MRRAWPQVGQQGAAEAGAELRGELLFVGAGAQERHALVGESHLQVPGGRVGLVVSVGVGAGQQRGGDVDAACGDAVQQRGGRVHRQGGQFPGQLSGRPGGQRVRRFPGR